MSYIPKLFKVLFPEKPEVGFTPELVVREALASLKSNGNYPADRKLLVTVSQANTLLSADQASATVTAMIQHGELKLTSDGKVEFVFDA